MSIAQGVELLGQLLDAAERKGLWTCMESRSSKEWCSGPAAGMPCLPHDAGNVFGQVTLCVQNMGIEDGQRCLNLFSWLRLHASYDVGHNHMYRKFPALVTGLYLFLSTGFHDHGHSVSHGGTGMRSDTCKSSCMSTTNSLSAVGSLLHESIHHKHHRPRSAQVARYVCDCCNAVMMHGLQHCPR